MDFSKRTLDDFVAASGNDDSSSGGLTFRQTHESYFAKNGRNGGLLQD
jgi:hypothetical protein